MVCRIQTQKFYFGDGTLTGDVRYNTNQQFMSGYNDLAKSTAIVDGSADPQYNHDNLEQSEQKTPENWQYIGSRETKTNSPKNTDMKTLQLDQIRMVFPTHK